MHILHLEDDAPLQEILRVALTCAQPVLKLVQFINSDRAVEYIINHTHEIDLYILDIRVPGGRDGLEVAKFIRALGVDTPIVITSAYRQPSQEILNSLDCEWMAKPWHVLKTIDTILPLAAKRTSIVRV